MPKGNSLEAKRVVSPSRPEKSLGISGSGAARLQHSGARMRFFASAASQSRNSAAIPGTAAGSVMALLVLGIGSRLRPGKVVERAWLTRPLECVGEKFLMRRECTGCARAAEKISSSTEEAGSSEARKTIHSPRTPLRPGRSEPSPNASYATESQTPILSMEASKF